MMEVFLLLNLIFNKGLGLKIGFKICISTMKNEVVDY